MILLLLFVFISGIMIILLFTRCKPHCSGAFCGNSSSDGCGGTCDCLQGGICQKNGVCCYPKCDGTFYGDDGCGGNCECNKVPGGKKLANGSCCYSLENKGIFCGPDGCGDILTCPAGTTCSSSDKLGICSNSGKDGYIYSVQSTPGMAQKNVSSALECSQWIPQNVEITLSNFPCSSDSDCPPNSTAAMANYPCKAGEPCPFVSSCVKGYCTKNNIYQYWNYDPSNKEYNCTKYLAGSSVCGMEKPGASAFNVVDNIGPDMEKCGDICTISSSQNKAELNSTCTPNFTGTTIGINSISLQNPAFSQPCIGKESEDKCTYSDGVSSYSGICKSCIDNSLKCLPDRGCVSSSVSGSGFCSSDISC